MEVREPLRGGGGGAVGEGLSAEEPQVRVEEVGLQGLRRRGGGGVEDGLDGLVRGVTEAPPARGEGPQERIPLGEDRRARRFRRHRRRRGKLLYGEVWVTG